VLFALRYPKCGTLLSLTQVLQTKFLYDLVRFGKANDLYTYGSDTRHEYTYFSRNGSSCARRLFVLIKCCYGCFGIAVINPGFNRILTHL
jgi:hypothetical protein